MNKRLSLFMACALIFSFVMPIETASRLKQYKKFLVPAAVAVGTAALAAWSYSKVMSHNLDDYMGEDRQKENFNNRINAIKDFNYNSSDPDRRSNFCESAKKFAKLSNDEIKVMDRMFQCYSDCDLDLVKKYCESFGTQPPNRLSTTSDFTAHGVVKTYLVYCAYRERYQQAEQRRSAAAWNQVIINSIWIPLLYGACRFVDVLIKRKTSRLLRR